MLKYLLRIEGSSSEQHRFIGTAAAPLFHTPQPVMLEQATKNGFYFMLPLPAHVRALPTMLASERPVVVGTVSGVQELPLFYFLAHNFACMRFDGNYESKRRSACPDVQLSLTQRA